ncbi:MAG TPA: hypothetical protein H9887_08820 [Candidatus Dorea intestinavium]|nr:hypothetical protein [Candidatus Dorea intestinavium]
MTKQMSESPKEQNKRTRIHWILISILITIISVAAVWSAATFFITKQEARHVLREAKDVRLAMRYVTIRGKAEDTAILDRESDSGFAGWAEDEIRNLTQIKGDLYLVYLNQNNPYEYRFFYTKGKYLVDYTSMDKNKTKYKVYDSGHAVLD